ncbi:MAG: DoxX family protein, partial [Verrucomicrobiota bacterium]
FRTNHEVAPLILRVLLAVVMFPHGAQKALGWFGGYGFSGTMKFFTENAHIPAPLAFLAILAEFGGSIALFFGLVTRLSAFGIGTTLAVAAMTVHVKNGFFMNWNGVVPPAEGFEYHILVVAIAIALMLQGGGKLALDALIYRKLCRTDSDQKTK